MKQALQPLLITLLLLSAAAFFGGDLEAAQKSKKRDWSLAEIRQAIARNKDAFQDILVNISIPGEDTLVVTMVTSRLAMSGSGQRITLTYDETQGWHVTELHGFDK